MINFKGYALKNHIILHFSASFGSNNKMLLIKFKAKGLNIKFSIKLVVISLSIIVFNRIIMPSIY